MNTLTPTQQLNLAKLIFDELRVNEIVYQDHIPLPCAMHARNKTPCHPILSFGEEEPR